MQRNVVYMTMGKNDPLHILRVKSSLPDRMDQHCRAAAVSGIDQKQPVSGIDQVHTDPAVTHIVDISKHMEWFHITRILLRPVFGHWILFKLHPPLTIILIIFLHAHGNTPSVF